MSSLIQKTFVRLPFEAFRSSELLCDVQMTCNVRLCQKGYLVTINLDESVFMVTIPRLNDSTEHIPLDYKTSV